MTTTAIPASLLNRRMPASCKYINCSAQFSWSDAQWRQELIFHTRVWSGVYDWHTFGQTLIRLPWTLNERAHPRAASFPLLTGSTHWHTLIVVPLTFHRKATAWHCVLTNNSPACPNIWNSWLHHRRWHLSSSSCTPTEYWSTHRYCIRHQCSPMAVLCARCQDSMWIPDGQTDLTCTDLHVNL